MSQRKNLPKDIEAEILGKSRRRCCLCFALNGDFDEKRGQIAHLDKNNSNKYPENLAYLCLEHHDQYDSRTSQSKGLTIKEVKEFRANLYIHVAAILPSLNVQNEREDGMVIYNDSIQPDVHQIKQQSDISGIAKLAQEIGISEKQLAEDIEAISILTQKIDRASLSRTQMRIMALIVKNTDNSEVPRRVVESAANYDYRSIEFLEEIMVLEHRELAYLDEDDGNIHLHVGDAETWQTLLYLVERKDLDILEFLKAPHIELLISDD